MKRVIIIVISTLAVVGILTVVQAGSLSPSAPPTGTMYDLSSLFNPLASTSYDSSGITADSNGSSIEIMKCIIQKMHGGTC